MIRQPSSGTDMQLRSATAADRVFIMETARRLANFQPPSWRSGDEIIAREIKDLEAFFDSPKVGAALFVAERRGTQPLGFVYLETQQDHLTGGEHGHVSTVAVSEQTEGTGVGAALMRAAEAWARSKGFRLLTLNVFAANRRARRVYEHLGYRAEMLRYVKTLE